MMAEQAISTSRRARPWRIAFIIYALALTAGTHWPNLTIDPQAVPGSDKTMHVIAFAALTWGLWLTRWVRRRWLVVAAAIVWAGLDEFSQALPGLGRNIGADDLTASAAGIIIAGLWLWALQPVGGSVNRLRLSLHRTAFEELFRSRRVWAMFIALLAACAIPPAVMWFVLAAPQEARFITIAAVVWAVASVVLLLDLWRRQRLVVIARRLCFSCGEPVGAITFDAAGAAACPRCGAPLHAGQWADPTPPAAGALLGMIIWPLGAAVAVIAAGFLLLWLSTVIYAHVLASDPTAGFAPRAARLFGSIPPALTSVVDLLLMMVLFAVGTRIYRTRLARYYDRSVRCRRCGHDLRGTPTDQGVGRCGECGTPFMRLPPEPPSD